MIALDTALPLVATYIIDATGNRFSQHGVDKIVNVDFFERALRFSFPSVILELPNEFFLFCSDALTTGWPGFSWDTIWLSEHVSLLCFMNVALSGLQKETHDSEVSVQAFVAGPTEGGLGLGFGVFFPQPAPQHLMELPLRFIEHPRAIGTVEAAAPFR